MNSTVTNSLNFSNLDSPKSNTSSLFGDSLSRWKRTPEKSLSYDEEEYGGIEKSEYSEPFVIKFHNIAHGERVNGQQRMEVMCQLDDFIEVPIADAAKCLDCMTDERLLLDNVEIEVKICAPTCKIAIENVLRRFVERRERCIIAKMPVKRLVFFIYDVTYAKELAPILHRIAPECQIFNFGIPKMKTYPLPPTTEARYVGDFLSLFLDERNETLRVLHIFNFVTLDIHLQRILRRCARLRHITLSNIDDISLFELPLVESVLLDSCDFSITMFDEMFAERHPRLFPNATTYGFLRSPVTLAIRAIRQWATDRVNDDRTELDFYQPERDFRKFLFESSKLFEVVSDDKELEGEVQIRGHIGGPLITVFNKDRVYNSRRTQNNE